jgi:hypothetical protein
MASVSSDLIALVYQYDPTYREIFSEILKNLRVIRYPTDETKKENDGFLILYQVDGYWKHEYSYYLKRHSETCGSSRSD